MFALDKMSIIRIIDIYRSKSVLIIIFCSVIQSLTDARRDI